MSELAEPEQTPEEHLRYAVILEFGVRLALLVLVVSYTLYLTGWVKPLVPIAEVQQHWGESHTAYAASTGCPTGWGWIHHLDRADMQSVAGIAILGLLSVAALLSILPATLRRRDWPFAVVLGTQILILLLAASGILGGRG